MRLWSIHPTYLDAKGLVALWREGLLAQKVLRGETRGYRNHPQLRRFRATENPVGAISLYLRKVAEEAGLRGYHFDRGKITPGNYQGKMSVTRGQLDYEFSHLLEKLKGRDPERYLRLKRVRKIAPHPLFSAVGGEVETWEIRSNSA